MKKFRYAFPISAYVIYALLMVVSVLSIVLASLRLAEVGNFVSVYPATDIVSIVLFSVFFILMAIIVFGTSYRFTEKELVLERIFFRKKIDRDHILKCVTDESAGLSALYYIDPIDPENLLFVVICLPRSKKNAFFEALRTLKPEIILESNSDQA